MNSILNELISAILQVIVFTLLPFIFFLFRKDKSISLFKYIGLTGTTTKAIRYSLLTSLLFLITGVGLIFFDDAIREMLLKPPSVTGNIRIIESPAVAIVVILIVALIKTSFSEEIFFRGFIAKRLINLWGFVIGNTAQAILFGLVHMAIFWKLMSIGPIILIFLLTATGGWVIGLIKEKYGRGSIIPGWIAHGLGNTISYFIIVFFL